ncbi:MAG: histidine kinase [Sulfuricellaceae bacterium]|nr:histidine kinase [Sulfuricellaceae bacterium]
MRSIKQNTPAASLPDFCNLGVMLRILVIVDALSVAAAAVKSPTWDAAWTALLEISLALQPVLLASLVALGAGCRPLRRLRYRAGIAAVFAVVLALTAAGSAWSANLLDGAFAYGWARGLAFAAAICAVLLGYFHLRSKALSPAVTEARLQALQARIRPHFLFNSINAVLSLIRSDPPRAEQALENMADLFRVLMADNRQLTTLEQEVALSRQYLELEQLRLGERLQVAWRIDNMPGDALIPPLVLQPLLENAVYHGIEPAAEPGEIGIDIYLRRDQVHLVLRNPYRSEGSHHAGNKMALANIRERLQLHFDAEATLDSSLNNQTYQVHITLPYTTAEAEG